MIVNKLILKNFRNIESEEIEFHPNINVLYGDNGQGKTNVVESLSYLSLLKSFRGSENKNLIRLDQDFASIEAYTDSKRFKCVISKEKRKCFINDVAVKKLSDFIGLMNVVVFSPENVNLFKDSPSERRSFLDDEISKLSPAYYVCINDYKELKKDRNELLRKKDNLDKKLLETFNNQLSRYNYQIVKKRKEFIEDLNKDITDFYDKLAGTNSRITVKYISDFIDDDVESINKKLENNLEDDLSKEQTVLGIHRDDVVLYLDDKQIEEFGSQGQNRLAVVSLKLSTLKIIKEHTGDDGIVVLDDVLSELDQNKQERLLNELKISNQIFITTAIKINEHNNLKSYCVEDGKIRRS